MTHIFTSVVEADIKATVVLTFAYAVKSGSERGELHDQFQKYISLNSHKYFIK